MNLCLYFPHLLSGVDEIQLEGSEYSVELLCILGKCIPRRLSFS